jgi:uncharacterized protein YndB with AHSA1/START domain
MIDFTIETEIERPPAEVFAFATDPEQLPRWQTNTVSATAEEPGPLRVGSRLREVHRGPGGRPVESLVEVSALEVDRAFGLRMIEGPLPIDADLAFEPTTAGTRLRFRVHGRPQGPMRLLQPLLHLALRRQFRRHCDELKRVLEGEAQPTA